MDLNRFYYDHQIALMRAAAARNGHVRTAHQDDAARIAEHIEQNLRLRGAGAVRRWEVRYRSNDQPAATLQTGRPGTAE